MPHVLHLGRFFQLRFSSNLVLSMIVFSVFTEFQVINNQRNKTLEVSVYKTFLRAALVCVE